MYRDKIIKYLSIIIFIILTISIIIPNYVNANSVGFKSFNNAPRKNFTVQSNKYADVKMTIKDDNKISSVDLYIVKANGTKKKVTFSSSNANTKNSQEHIYTLSHKNLLEGKTKQFYIKIKDKTGNVQNSYFRVVAKTEKVNNKTKHYYAIDDGPRVINWTVKNNNTISFDVKDNAGTKVVKVQDANKNNKEIYNFKNLKAGTITKNIGISKFKAVNNIYKIKVITIDSGSAAQQSVRTLYFTLPEKTSTGKAKQTTPSTPSTSTNKNVTSFISALDSISKQLEKDIKAGHKWTYSKNGISTTFKSAINNNNRHINCADYVMWGLRKSGILASNQKFYFSSTMKKIVYSNNSVSKVKQTLNKYVTIINAGNKLPSELIKKDKIKKGDILLYDKGGHMNVYAGDKKFYDGGRREGKTGDYVNGKYVYKTFGPIKVNTTSGYRALYIIRLK